MRHTEKRRIRMDYAAWVERMRTPEPHRAAIRSFQSYASNQTAAYFAIEPDGSFSIDALQIEATACHAFSVAPSLKWTAPGGHSMSTPEQRSNRCS